MKLRHLAPLAITASAAAIALAPIASAADVVSVQQSPGNGVQQSPGNAQVTATPGAAAQQAANSNCHSAEMWALCCSTTDLVHSAVLNHAVGLAISAAEQPVPRFA